MSRGCMRKVTYSILIISVFLYHYTGNLKQASGNAAVWRVGTVEGVPGPIKQNKLVLEREHVIFKKWDKVNAHFWVNNPTGKEIKETIGFPLEYDYKRYAEDYRIENYVERANSWLNTFEVKSGGKKIDVKLTSSLQSYLLSNMLLNKTVRDRRKPAAINSDYPIVYIWEMSFPPQTTTEFTVEYPLYPSRQENGFVNTYSFNYITHTGGYWAQPIKEATFEYCGEDKYILDKIDGAISSWMYVPQIPHNGRTGESVGWYIEPRPFEINAETGCIVWKRSNWTPKKTDDDIRFSIYEEKELNFDFPDFPHQFWQWCGIANDNRVEGAVVAGQFAEKTRISGKYYSQAELLTLANKAYNFGLNSSSQTTGKSYDSLPEYLKIDFLSLFLRYLRNYIYANHGHEFNDANLADCFANVSSSKKKLNEFENRNIDLIMKMEKQLKDNNRNVWQKLIETEDLRHHSIRSMDGGEN